MNPFSRRGVLFGGAACLGLARPGMAATMPLPDPESGQVVVLFDISQELVTHTIGAGYDPLLEVKADGSMSARAVPPDAERAVGAMDAANLQDLMRFIVDEQDFFSIEADAITARIQQIGARDGRLFVVADAATTHVSITLQDRKHKVTLYAVGFAARLFPEIDALQRLRRIELRLLATAEALRGT